MPCNSDGYNDVSMTRSRYEELRNLEALCCAMMRAEPQILDRIDYPSSGVRMEWALEWWANHQQWDIERKAAQLREDNKRRTREEALAKLTTDEKAALGIKE